MAQDRIRRAKSSELKKIYDVLLLGYYGFGNLGDELLAEASVSLLKNCGVSPDKIAILSAAPEESEKKFGVRAFNRWSLSSISKACAMSRTLLLGGGGLFQDSTSMRSCIYYLAVMLIARMKGMKIWAEGQSVGPLRSAFARRITSMAMSLCAHISVRDDASFENISSFGLKSSLIPDLVMSLPLEKNECREAVIVFNARPGYDELSRKTAERCGGLAANRGMSVRGIAFSEEDVLEIRRLQSLQFIKIQDIIKVSSLEEFSEAVCGASYAVGMRLHFIILCCLAGIPALACAYDPKVSGFCKKSGTAMLGDDMSPPSVCENVENFSAARGKIRSVFNDGLRSVFGEKYKNGF